ncbi:MAG: pilin [Patescibacteria group bacterium]
MKAESIKARILLTVSIIFTAGIFVFLNASDTLAMDESKCWQGAANSSAGSGDEADFVYKCCTNLHLAAELETPRDLATLYASILGSKPRSYACAAACSRITSDMLTEEGWATRFEEMCCKALITKNLIDPDVVDKVEEQCKEAESHTGSSMCLIHKTRPDGLDQNCCLETEKEITILGGKQCKQEFYTGSDACKVDSKFSCCVCVDPNDNKKQVYIPGLFNCRGCKAECDKRASTIPNAQPDYANLPYSSSACTDTVEKYTGTKSEQAQKQAVKMREEVHIDSLCWTQKQCIQKNGKFKPGHGCPNKGNEGQGYCQAPEPDYELQYPIFGVTTIKGLKNFIAFIYNSAIGVLIIAAAVFFMWGAFKYLISSVATSIEKSKEIMVDSLVGLALGLGAYALLANVNPNTLEFRTLEIDMVNTMSFYNVVFCDDIIPKPKLADAGTLLEPIAYQDAFKKGFDKTVEDAECGKDYFIEGSDSTAVCSGKACKSGQCLHCSAGLSGGCKTSSHRELSCSDSQMGGNIAAEGSSKPVEIYAMVWKYNSDDEKFDTWELDRFEWEDENLRTASNGGASGYISGYVFKNITQQKVADILQKASESPRNQGGLVLVLRVDQSWDYDDMYFVITKRECNSGMATWGLSYTKATTAQIISPLLSIIVMDPSDLTLSGYLSRLNARYPTLYNDLISNQWTVQELQNMADGKELQTCNITIPEEPE